MILLLATLSITCAADRPAPLPGQAGRSTTVANNGMVATSHPLAAQIGLDVLKAGGNAIDAAVAATLVEGVVNPQMHTIGGECPILLRLAGQSQVIAVNGNTAAPRRATPEAYRARGLAEIPDEGILAAGVPAAFSALITVLSRWGTLSFADVSARARERKLRPADLQGGSFSISSLGGIGGTFFTPLVNLPEVAILGVGRMDWRPVWQDGAFVPRLLLPLSLSYDHRVIDGADAARFVTRLSSLLRDLRRLIL